MASPTGSQWDRQRSVDYLTKHLMTNMRLMLGMFNLAPNQVIGSTLLSESDFYQLCDLP